MPSLALDPPPPTFSPRPPQPLLFPAVHRVHPPDLILTSDSSQPRGHPSPQGSSSFLSFSFRADQASPSLHSLRSPPPSSIRLPCNTRHQTLIISSARLSTYLYRVIPQSFPPCLAFCPISTTLPPTGLRVLWPWFFGFILSVLLVTEPLSPKGPPSNAPPYVCPSAPPPTSVLLYAPEWAPLFPESGHRSSQAPAHQPSPGLKSARPRSPPATG